MTAGATTCETLEHPGGTPGPTAPIIDADTDDETLRHERRSIVCARCERRISDTASLFGMRSDRVQRVFSNPHGLLLEILTVRHAEGFESHPPATTEFTWYPGYSWEVITCQDCRAHLGWMFCAVDDSEPGVFWGLLKSAVRDG